MFGYATREMLELMLLLISFAHRVAALLANEEGQP